MPLLQVQAAAGSLKRSPLFVGLSQEEKELLVSKGLSNPGTFTRVQLGIDDSTRKADATGQGPVYGISQDLPSLSPTGADDRIPLFARLEPLRKEDATGQEPFYGISQDLPTLSPTGPSGDGEVGQEAPLVLYLPALSPAGEVSQSDFTASPAGREVIACWRRRFAGDDGKRKGAEEASQSASRQSFYGVSQALPSLGCGSMVYAGDKADRSGALSCQHSTSPDAGAGERSSTSVLKTPSGMHEGGDRTEERCASNPAADRRSEGEGAAARKRWGHRHSLTPPAVTRADVGGRAGGVARPRPAAGGGGGGSTDVGPVPPSRRRRGNVGGDSGPAPGEGEGGGGGERQATRGDDIAEAERKREQVAGRLRFRLLLDW